MDASRRLFTEDVRRTVLALDTYETFGLMDTWLRQVFVPGLPESVLTLLAGLFAPDPAWLTTPGWQGLFRDIELRELSEDRARQMLRSRGLTAPAVERAERFARGHPLALEPTSSPRPPAWTKSCAGAIR
jgi:hypothetical protein